VLPARECGAVSFVQRFGSALQLNVHFHVLVPESLFADDGTFHPLPPSEDADVESLLETFLRSLKRGRRRAHRRRASPWPRRWRSRGRRGRRE
jgi:hypothetical protein